MLLVYCPEVRIFVDLDCVVKAIQFLNGYREMNLSSIFTQGVTIPSALHPVVRRIAQGNQSEEQILLQEPNGSFCVGETSLIRFSLPPGEPKRIELRVTMLTPVLQQVGAIA